MATTDKKPHPERASTDASLRVEREKSDSAHANRQTSIEEEADAALEQSRGSTDEFLQATRETADERLARSEQPAEGRKSVARERVDEDAALQGERATADAERREERVEHKRALAALL